MKSIIIWAVSLLLVFTACESNKDAHNHENGENQKTYTCPMHPQIVSDEPGTCPICKMDLVPIEKGYSNSPAIMLSESQIKLANITTLPLSKSRIGDKTLLVGKVTENKEQSEIISSRVEGRIERLFIKETGRTVKQGEPLYAIYSEQLLTLQQEFLLAQEQYKKLGAEVPRFKSLMEAARKKLLLYGMSEAQVSNLGSAKTTNPNITFYAPVSGIISEISVSEGEYIPEGGKLFSIDKLDKVWVEAELYSGEAELVKKGDKVQVAVAGFENQPVIGKVSFISPEFKNNTQIFIARVEIPNPDRNFLPGMQANVILPHSEKTSLAVPIDAVVRSGDGTHVWVTAGESTFVPKLVKTGVENANQIEIVEGLDKNDTIVTSGAYLLYGEYSLKKGGNLMVALKDQGMEKKQPDEKTSQIGKKQFQVDNKFQKQLAEVFEQYIVLKEALVASDPSKAKAASLSVLNSVKAVSPKLLKDEALAVWNNQAQIVTKSLNEISSSDKLDSQRIAFAPLSKSLYEILKSFEISDLNAYYQFCPMALNNKGAYWLSDSKEIRNPYFGDMMLSCGSVEEKVN